jgi:dihydrofolate reductase
VRKLVVSEWLSLDGVAQSPGYADEDPSGGFDRGGWHLRYLDDVAGQRLVEDLNKTGGFVFGRRTYEIFAGYWPNAGEEEQAMAQPLNTKPKYVASRTLSDPLEWQNSTVLEGDVAEAVAALKQEDGDELNLIGSTVLAQTLIEHDLVDELRLMIDPLLLGGGKRVFPDDGVARTFQLVDSKLTTTGAILATYALERGSA